jgi:hypothetical protein
MLNSCLPTLVQAWAVGMPDDQMQSASIVINLVTMHKIVERKRETLQMERVTAEGTALLVGISLSTETATTLLAMVTLEAAAMVDTPVVKGVVEKTMQMLPNRTTMIVLC